MTNFEKWKKKIAEAEDERDFLYQLNLMGNEIYDKQCCQAQNCEMNCVECRTQWLKQEADK